jgi:hypothetical protein
MIKDCPGWMAPAAIALWLAVSATAQAQPAAAPILPTATAPTAPPVGAASAPNPVDDVTVLSRRRETYSSIPDAKRAQYDADVAKEAAFRAYRASRPPIVTDSKGVSDPNDDSKDFPGLQTYLPK